jgi:ABC-type sugar transport system ATPase subunit
MTLADRIVVLRAGCIEQVGNPVELYEHPANRFVAGFIGSPKMNFLAARVVAVSGERVKLEIAGLAGGALELPVVAGQCAPGDQVTLGIRPEHLRIGAAGSAALAADIEFCEQLGGISYLYAPAHPAGPLIVWREGGGDLSGQRLDVSFDPGRCHLFAESGGAIAGRRTE